MPMTCTIRPAERADAASIASACRLHVEYGLRPTWTAARVARAIDDPRAFVLVADSRGDLAGFLVARRGEFSIHLQLLAVLPRYRRRRLGSRLLGTLERDGITAGSRCLRLEVRSGNLGARRFYRQHGYRMLAMRSNYYGGGEAAAIMARGLRDAPAGLRAPYPPA